MIVFLLAETLDEIFDEDGLLSSWQFLEIISQVEYIFLGDGSSFLHSRNRYDDDDIWKFSGGWGDTRKSWRIYKFIVIAFVDEKFAIASE